MRLLKRSRGWQVDFVSKRKHLDAAESFFFSEKPSRCLWSLKMGELWIFLFIVQSHYLNPYLHKWPFDTAALQDRTKLVQPIPSEH